MKVNYRGHEISVWREKCLGGWSMIYYCITRDDGYIGDCGFSDSADTVRDFVGFMKERVDAELEEDDPWGEKAEFDDV